MVFCWTNALIEIGHALFYIAGVASASFFIVGFESFEILVLSRASHTMTANIEIACITTCEEKLLLLGNCNMTNVAI